MELIIHCGAHKTGTTSIQSMLNAKKDLLRKKGVLYIPEKKINETGVIEFLHSANSSSMDANTIRRALVKCIDNNQPKSVVISHESILSYANIHPKSTSVKFYTSVSQSLGNLQLLKLDSMFSSIRVLLYVRRQDQFLQSLYMENLSKGLWTLPMDQAIEGMDYGDLSWLHLAERLSAGLGRENVIVRPFEIVRGGWQCLVADFCKATGIEIDSFISKKNKNESFSKPAHYLALKILPNIDRARRPQVSAILKMLFPPTVFGKSNPMTESTKREIIETLKEDNSALFKTYITDFPDDFYHQY